MKILLELPEHRVSFFMELIRSFGYIKVLDEGKTTLNSDTINDYKEAFNDIKLHEKGVIKLKTAKELLSEI